MAVATAPLISLDNVSRIFDDGSVVALDGIDMSVARGEFVSIVGPSGSGKSSLVHMMAGFDLPTGGRVLWQGREVADRRTWTQLRRSKIGIVFQEFLLLPTLSAIENVEIAMSGAGLSAPARKKRAAALLEQVGLGGRFAHLPFALSGGERQRVAIARSLANRPELLLSDEPTGNLDSANAAAVIELMLALRAEAGMTLVLVTHDEALAARADRLIHIKDGRIAGSAVVGGQGGAMTLPLLAYRNLLRRPTRTLLLVFSIALAIATAVALLALSRGIERSTADSARERGADLSVLQRDASDIFSGFVDANLGPAIAAIPGVKGVGGELVMFAPVDGEYQFLAVGMADDSYFWPAMPVAEGRLPAKGERHVALIGESVAKALGKRAGAELTVFDQKVTIIGVTGYQAAVNRGVIVLRLRDLQEMSFRADQVTVFHVVLDPGLGSDGIAAVKKKIEALGPLSVDPTDQLLAGDRNLKILKAVSQAISLIALITAGLSVLNVLLMAVQERTRETGIMMAIGWSDRRIMAAIVLEGMIVGMAGCIVGVPLGFLACSLFNLLPTIGGYLSFRPSLDAIVPSVAGALLLSALGSLYPAWRAVSTTPAEALRRA